MSIRPRFEWLAGDDGGVIIADESASLVDDNEDAKIVEEGETHRKTVWNMTGMVNPGSGLHRATHHSTDHWHTSYSGPIDRCWSLVLPQLIY